MLDGRTGAIYGRVTSDPPVAKSPWQQTLFAQVTPYQVHAKLGHFNTLVWVTDLATGEPVEDAAVSIYVDRLVDLSATFDVLGEAQTDESGLAILAGTVELDPDLSLLGYNCSSRTIDACPRLFVRVQQEERIALLPLESRFEISAYRASNYTVFNHSLPEFGMADRRNLWPRHQ